MKPIDHASLVNAHIISQYVDSPNLIAWIKSILLEADVLEDVFDGLFSSRDYTLNSTSGVNLDVIGRIVGQSRSVATAGETYFGFAGHIQAGTYGDHNDPGAGARYRTLSEDTDGSRLLPDPEYRQFIKAKINRNHSTPTVENVIDVAQQYFGFADVEVLDANDHVQGSMEAAVIIHRALTQEEKALLALAEALPRPAGVLYWLYERPFGGNSVLIGTTPATQPDVPVITLQPIDAVVAAPNAVVFSSDGTNYDRIQWEFNGPQSNQWVDAEGFTSTSMTFTTTDIWMDQSYVRVKYYKGLWETTSDEVLLTVT